MRRVSSVPSMPGISQSVITTSGASSWKRRQASSPSAATVHAWPSRSMAAETSRRVPGSSSAMRMCMVGAEGGQGEDAPVIGRPPRILGRGLDVRPCPVARPRPTDPAMDAAPLVDPTRLPELRADYGDVAVQLLDLFERTAAETIAEIRAALDAGDGEEVRRLAHR